MCIRDRLHVARRMAGRSDESPGHPSSHPTSDPASAEASTRRPDRGVELLLGISVAGVVASAAEMAWLYHPGVDITRLYFGTDTHAQSILVGAVLACVLTLIQRRRGLDGMAPTVASTPAKVVLTMVGAVSYTHLDVYKRQ